MGINYENILQPFPKSLEEKRDLSGGSEIELDQWQIKEVYVTLIHFRNAWN